MFETLSHGEWDRVMKIRLHKHDYFFAVLLGKRRKTFDVACRPHRIKIVVRDKEKLGLRRVVDDIKNCFGGDSVPERQKRGLAVVT